MLPQSASFTPHSPHGSTAARLPVSLFSQFAEHIYNLSGLRFEAGKTHYLAAKIGQRMQALGLTDYQDYLARLQSKNGVQEASFLLDEITVNETFFYRNENQLRAFLNEILLPLAFARRLQGQTRLRIWSAAASTGDELYTLALMVKDAGLLGQGLTFEFIGTDISPQTLAHAQQGTYARYNIRNVPPAILKQNFSHAAATGTWSLNPDIKALCTFTQMNLMDPLRTHNLGRFDAIFCRNALAYFDDRSKQQVLLNLCNALQDDGTILLGHADDVSRQRHVVVPDASRPAALAYRKAAVPLRHLI